MTSESNVNQARLDKALNLIYKNVNPVEGTSVFSQDFHELTMVLTIEPIDNGLTKARVHVIDCVASEYHFIFDILQSGSDIPKLFVVGAGMVIEADWYHMLRKTRVPRHIKTEVEAYIEAIFTALLLADFPGMDEAFDYVRAETRRILKSCLK